MKGTFYKQLILPVTVAFGLLLCSGISAQQLKVTAKFDSTSILIGDQVKLHLELELPSTAKVQMPQFRDTLASHVEIVKALAPTQSQKDGKLFIKQELLVTSFDSGYHKISPIAIPYVMGAVKDTLRTASLFLSVNTLPVDTTKSIKDIKAPMSAPFSILDYWLYIAGFFGLVILVFAIWLIVKLFRHEPIFGPPRVILPPHAIALQELDKLRAEKLWQNDKTKLYYTRLTEIIRTYIEKRFEIKALEMTSDEIVVALRGVNYEEQSSIDLLQKMFSTADLVKFAKGIPLPNENEVNLLNAYQFVNNTKIVVSGEAEAGEKAENSGNETPQVS
jgi:Predicted membrane protein